MTKNYPIKIVKDDMGYSKGMSLGISSKTSIEVASYVRGMDVTVAKQRLNEVLQMKRAIPYTRFNSDVGHKRKIGPGRYPIKTCTMFLSLIESAESNAIDKGLNSKDLFIFHVSAHRDAQQWKYGRQRRRKAKRTNLYIILKSKEESKAKKEDKKTEVAPVKEANPELTKEKNVKPEVKPDLPKNSVKNEAVQEKPKEPSIKPNNNNNNKVEKKEVKPVAKENNKEKVIKEEKTQPIKEESKKEIKEVKKQEIKDDTKND